jgi:hypothetical protein
MGYSCVKSILKVDKAEEFGVVGLFFCRKHLRTEEEVLLKEYAIVKRCRQSIVLGGVK